MADQEAKGGAASAAALLRLESFHRALLALSFEMVVASYRMVRLLCSSSHVITLLERLLCLAANEATDRAARSTATPLTLVSGLSIGIAVRVMPSHTMLCRGQGKGNVRIVAGALKLTDDLSVPGRLGKRPVQKRWQFYQYKSPLC